MKTQIKPLTIYSLLYRKSLDFIHTLLGYIKKVSDPKIEYIKTKKSFIKKYTLSTFGLRYASILNETFFLKIFTDHTYESMLKKFFRIPKILNFKQTDNTIEIETTFIQGVEITSLSQDKKIEILSNIVEGMRVVSDTLLQTKVQLPTRSTLILALVFPYFWLLAILKSRSDYMGYVRILLKFYASFYISLFSKKKLGISHRDLHSHNIFFDGKLPIILDWEGAVVTDNLYDIAMICRLYTGEIEVSKLVTFVEKYAKTYGEKNRFIYLTIFNCIQTLAVDSIQSDVYIQAHTYMKNLQEYVMPTLGYKKSIFEVLNSITLKIISLFMRLGLIKPATTSKIILCYHSISNDFWRFSTPIKKFESQIEYLSKTFNIVSLNDLMKKNTLSGVAITFDDGYASVFDNAFPILQKYNIKPTVFALGDPDRANRDELDNHLPLLSGNSIQKLIHNRWEIGYHTNTHSNLLTATHDALNTEIISSKSEFEKTYAIPLKYFAYPRGGYNSRILSLVSQAGYTFGFTVNSGVVSQNNLLISRIPVEGKLSIDEFKALLSIPGINITAIFMKILQLKSHVHDSIVYMVRFLYGLTKKLTISVHNDTLDSTYDADTTVTKKSRYIPIITLALLCSLLLVASIRGNVGNPDGHALNTKSWQDNGPFELSPERGRFALTYSVIENSSMYFSVPIARFATPDLGYIHGNYVSLFAPAVSFIVAPGYLIGRALNAAQFGAYAVISIFALLNAILIFLLSKKISGNMLNSSLVSLIFLFATPAYAYSTTLYQHHISTFLILLSIYLLVRYSTVLSLFGIWFLCALSIPVDYPNLFMMFPIGIFALGKIIYIRTTEQKIHISIRTLRILTLIGVAAPLAFFLWFNNASYGNPLQFSGTVQTVRTISEDGKPISKKFTDIHSLEKYINDQDENGKKNAVGFFKSRNLINGLYLHILSPDRGMLSYTPIILLGFFGIYYLLRSNPYLATLMLGVMSMNILLYSLWDDPWGGWAFGSRYLVPTYALLAIFLSSFLVYARRYFIVLLFIMCIGVYSVIVNSAGALSTIAIPPKVEVLELEKLSGREEKYTFMRGIDLLKNGDSKSFFFRAKAHTYVSAWQYYLIITTVISVLMIALIVFFYVIE